NRDGSAAGISFSCEFPQALFGLQHHGFLASLAYFIITVAAGLPLHSAGGKSPRKLADISQPDAHHAARRALARGELEFRDLGRLSRGAPLDRTDARKKAFGTDTCPLVSRASDPDVRPGLCRMGVLSGPHARLERLRSEPNVRWNRQRHDSDHSHLAAI